MFCPKCGREFPDGKSCPDCHGEGCSPAKAKEIFSSKIFLILCLVSATVVIASLVMGNINLVMLLVTVGVWMIFAGASSEAPLKLGGFKMLSFVTRLNIVLQWIGFGGAVLGTVCSGIAALLVGENAHEMYEELTVIFNQFGKAYPDLWNEISSTVDTLKNAIGVETEKEAVMAVMIFSAATLLVAAVIILVMNLCFFRKFDKYTHSLVVGYKNGSMPVFNSGVATRFLIFGILLSVPALTSLAALAVSPLSVIVNIGTAAFFVIMFVFIRSARSK